MFQPCLSCVTLPFRRTAQKSHSSSQARSQVLPFIPVPSPTLSPSTRGSCCLVLLGMPVSGLETCGTWEDRATRFDAPYGSLFRNWSSDRSLALTEGEEDRIMDVLLTTTGRNVAPCSFDGGIDAELQRGMRSNRGVNRGIMRRIEGTKCWRNNGLRSLPCRHLITFRFLDGPVSCQLPSGLPRCPAPSPGTVGYHEQPDAFLLLLSLACQSTPKYGGWLRRQLLKQTLPLSTQPSRMKHGTCSRIPSKFAAGRPTPSPKSVTIQ